MIEYDVTELAVDLSFQQHQIFKSFYRKSWKMYQGFESMISVHWFSDFPIEP